jgi:hypothetical protein
MGTTYHNKPIVTDGLVFCVDPANKVSYPGSGANIFNILNTSLSASLQDDGTSPLPQFDPSQGQGVINFDGVDDQAVTNTKFSAFQTNKWSLSVWFRIESGYSSYNAICGNGYPFQVYVYSNKIHSWLSSNANGAAYFLNNFTSTQTISADTWYYLVFTRNINNYAYYINGASDNTTTSASTLCAAPTYNFHFGDLWSGNNSYCFKGDIGPLHIYDNPLSASEVAQNYNALKNRFI